MKRWIVVGLCAIVMAAGVAAAQTTTPATSAPTATSTAGMTSTTSANTTTSSTTSTANAGTFDRLSPGDQKIARALFDAQVGGATPGTTKLSLDDIAALKGSGKGWGVVFQDMKARGLVQARNLGQVVSQANPEARVRADGATLQDVERAVFDRQGAPAQRPVEARFRDLSLTKADQQALLKDIQRFGQLPEGSRVRLEGRIDGRPFEAEVRNHEGGLRVETRGLAFASRQDAQVFVDSLRQAGAERVRVRGTIDGQRFEARAREQNGRVDERARLDAPRAEREVDRHGGVPKTRMADVERHDRAPKTSTVITTGSNRTTVAGSGATRGHVNGLGGGDDHRLVRGGEHGGEAGEAGRHGSVSVTAGRKHGGELSAGGHHAGSGGQGGRGKD